MRFAIVTNASGAVVREFDAADDYVAPAHKFGADKTERVVRVVEVDPPALEAGKELQRAPDELTETELRRGWVAVATPVPEQVTLRQFLMASDRSGLLATMEALKVNEAIPPQTRRDIHFFLEYSNFIERNHPLIAQLAPVISIDGQPITDAQIDDVFRLASSL